MIPMSTLSMLRITVLAARKKTTQKCCSPSILRGHRFSSPQSCPCVLLLTLPSHTFRRDLSQILWTRPSRSVALTHPTVEWCHWGLNLGGPYRSRCLFHLWCLVMLSHVNLPVLAPRRECSGAQGRVHNWHKDK